MRYRMIYRPASTFTLPRGLRWDYVETPKNDTGIQQRRGELPVSQHPFGVIETDRPLTTDELASFEVEEVQ